MPSFNLPDLGEGLQDAEVVEWLVRVGDLVQLDEVVVVVETAKAIVELPSPAAGEISDLCVAEGERVPVGAALFHYRSVEGAESDNSQVSRTDSVGKDDARQAQAGAEAHGQARGSVSVVGELPDAQSHEVAEEHFATFESENQYFDTHSTLSQQKPPAKAISKLLAPPSIMAMAHELGIDLAEYGRPYENWTMDALQTIAFPEEEGYRSMRQGVERHADMRSDRKERTDVGSGGAIKLSGAHKVMAQTMMKSHQHVPAVTLFDDVNINAWHEGEDTTIRLLRALISACRAVPMLNAWFDEEETTIQPFEDINAGIAVNSDDGLFVPVLRAVQSLSAAQQRRALDQHVHTIKTRKIKPQAMLGATITLSNFGTLAGRYATPLIVPPQVAILGAGRKLMAPVCEDKKVVAAMVLPLSLSFDHRAASGADAARFMQQLKQDLAAAE